MKADDVRNMFSAMDEARTDREWKERQKREEAWCIGWGSYVGKVRVVMPDLMVHEGEAIDHHTEADHPRMLIELDNGENHWLHPRDVRPLPS